MKRIKKDIIYSFFFIILLLFLFSSCSGVMNRLMEKDSYESMPAEYESSPAIQGKESLSMSDSLDISRVEDSQGDMGLNSQVDKNDEGGIENPEKRKHIYSGNADLLVEDLQETKRNIEIYTGQIGGYVESMHDYALVIRVPADSFELAFNWILDMGTVRYQSVETADITEFYNDLFSRLEISQLSRKRLYELLKRTNDTTEQVQILKEIGRLTEKIESTRLLLQSLDSFIAFSRISITLESRLDMDYMSKQEIPFSWIRNLSPLYSTSSRLEAKISLEPGEDFAVFDKEKIYHAENWDGVQIRISTVDNDPSGDNIFWKRALLFHLDDFYESRVEKNILFGENSIDGVLWTSRDREPFQYFTGVFVDKKKLHIIEIFSPVYNDELFDRLFDTMKEGEIN